MNKQIYTIEDENGKRYEATYGSAYVSNFFIRTIEHYKKIIELTIQSYDEKIAGMNKKRKFNNFTSKFIIIKIT